MSRETLTYPGHGRSRASRTAIALALAAALLALAAPLARAQQQAATPLLPDLDQDTIRHQILTRHHVPGDAQPHFRLGFDSAASNLGDGPMLLHGVRTNKNSKYMRADQLVRGSDGRLTLYKGVGRLRFVTQHDHRHWHFLDFERYELRDDRTMELVASDMKSGFCLGDRYRSHPKLHLPARARRAVYGDNCGLELPNLTGIFEGISPGWGDRYVALLEGQYIDITHVPSGIYQLVNRVNPAGALHERTLLNDAATNRVVITWPHGHGTYPTVRIIGVCPATFGCVGGWGAGPAPIPSDLVGTPFGDALAGAATSAPPTEESAP